MGFNQMMRRMQWLTFARLSNPSYPSLIKRFYINLSKSHKHLTFGRLSNPSYPFDTWHPKPKSKHLTPQFMLLLIFVQHNILTRGGHRSEPSYMDLWLVDSILCGRKVNLGFLIVQHMANVLASAHSVLPYGMCSLLYFSIFRWT